MYLKAMLVNAIFCPSAAKQMGEIILYKEVNQNINPTTDHL